MGQILLGLAEWMAGHLGCQAVLAEFGLCLGPDLVFFDLGSVGVGLADAD
jgi:hypothetical protein